MSTRLTLDPIINIPVTNEWGGYVLGGLLLIIVRASWILRPPSRIGLQRRSSSGGDRVSTRACPLNGNFLHASQNEFGENFGGGIDPQDKHEY